VFGKTVIFAKQALGCPHQLRVEFSGFRHGALLPLARSSLGCGGLPVGALLPLAWSSLGRAAPVGAPLPWARRPHL
jgi:hypothetical protein